MNEQSHYRPEEKQMTEVFDIFIKTKPFLSIMYILCEFQINKQGENKTVLQCIFPSVPVAGVGVVFLGEAYYHDGQQQAASGARNWKTGEKAGSKKKGGSRRFANANGFTAGAKEKACMEPPGHRK